MTEQPVTPPLVLSRSMAMELRDFLDQMLQHCRCDHDFDRHDSDGSCQQCNCPSSTPADEQSGRHTVDTITSNDLDELYATIRRLNYRAQQAESRNATLQRAVAQWEVSERGTFIPLSSLAAIGRAAGTDILGSVRHLRHFQRVEQAEIAATRAEAALARVRALHTDKGGWCAACGAPDCENNVVDWPCDTIRALNPEEPTP